MKKWIRLCLLFVVLCLAFVGCGTKEENRSDEDDNLREEKCDVSLYKHGLEIIELMEELADSDDYAKMMSVSEELIDMILNAGEGDYSEKKPVAVYEITFEKEAYEYLLEEYGGFENLEGLSDNIKDYTYSKLTNSIINLVNSRVGVNALAAAGISSVTKAFVCDRFTENMIYLYVYEDALPIAICFVEGEDDAVMATGSFLFDGELFTEQEDFMEYIEEYISESGIPVSIKEVKMK